MDARSPLGLAWHIVFRCLQFRAINVVNKIRISKSHATECYSLVASFISPRGTLGSPERAEQQQWWSCLAEHLMVV